MAENRTDRSEVVKIDGDTPTMRLLALLEVIAAKDHLVTLQGLVEETGLPKPTLHRMAWGTDKHDDYFVHMADRAEAGDVGARERQHLLDELDGIAARGALGPELRAARERIAAAPAAPPAAPPAAAGGTA